MEWRERLGHQRQKLIDSKMEASAWHGRAFSALVRGSTPIAIQAHSSPSACRHLLLRPRLIIQPTAVCSCVLVSVLALRMGCIANRGQRKASRNGCTPSRGGLDRAWPVDFRIFTLATEVNATGTTGNAKFSQTESATPSLCSFRLCRS